jgi:small GTP-binding protein
MKVILVGDSQVGKSCFRKRLMGESFDQNYIPTLGVEVVPIQTPDVTFNIWDCSGNPCFRGLGDGYYLGSQLAIIMCDPNTSLEKLEKWRQDVRRVIDIPYIVVMNKCETINYDTCKIVENPQNPSIVQSAQSRALEKVKALNLHKDLYNTMFKEVFLNELDFIDCFTSCKENVGIENFIAKLLEHL